MSSVEEYVYSRLAYLHVFSMHRSDNSQRHWRAAHDYREKCLVREQMRQKECKKKNDGNDPPALAMNGDRGSNLI